MQGNDEDIGRMLRETAGRLFTQHLTPATLREAEQGVWPQALWQATVDAGLTQALLPESAGGVGLAAAEALKLLRVAAEHGAPLPLAETMLSGWLLARAGLTPDDDTLTAGPLTFARADVLHRAGNGWRLAGVARRVPWARRARGLVLHACVDGAPYLALLEPASWHAEPGENLAREPRDDIRFDHTIENTRVRPIDLAPTMVLAAAAALRTQQIAGALARITALTVQYAQDRVQFGRAIGKFQAVQQNLAVLAGESAAALAAADLAAEAFDAPKILPIAAAKTRAGEAAGQAAAIAHQMHGAIGFTYEHSLHFFTKRLWSWRDEYGNETFWARLLGAHLAQAGADRLWAEIVAA
jgi:acyl-CoA dehydrogenase